MTIIVGVTNGSTVVIGGDSRFSAHSTIHHGTKPKVWRQGPFILGTTGSVREGQILRHGTRLPKLPDGELDAWLCVEFVDAIREARKSSGFDEKKTDGTEVGPRAMVGVRGRLFVVFEDYQVLEYAQHAAVGSGMDFALGSLSTTSKTRMSITRRVTAALDAACTNDCHCAPPFTILRGRAVVLEANS